ncbi:nuclear transport factor 2 family protein [Aeromicrobium sp. CTD01-1L150]|uniref:nuclear transport factor 2 family protein n=1 Tax=Aeromicrobium sp. CTD01-1L150 TaxID=3341830 RepID=UPI0035BFDF9F
MTRTTRDASLDLAARYLRAMDEARFDAVHALLSDGAVHEVPFAPESLGRRHEGREQIVALYAQAADMLVNTRVENLSIDTLAETPTTVVCRYDFDATLSSDGVSFRSAYVLFLHVRDGLIERVVELFDPAPLQAALSGPS